MLWSGIDGYNILIVCGFGSTNIFALSIEFEIKMKTREIRRQILWLLVHDY